MCKQNDTHNKAKYQSPDKNRICCLFINKLATVSVIGLQIKDIVYFKPKVETSDCICICAYCELFCLFWSTFRLYVKQSHVTSFK